MPLRFVPVDVPLGLGLDTKSSPVDNPIGSSQYEQNTEFTQTGGRRKRKGFNTQLGATFAGRPGRLLAHKDHLLAHANAALWDWSASASAFESVGTMRAIPVESQILKNNNTTILSTDSYTLNNFTLTVWVDATGTSAKVVDNITGALVTQRLALLTNQRAQSIKAFAMLHAGTPHFYVFAGGQAQHWNGTTNTWDGAATTVASAIGTIYGIGICAHGQNMTVVWAGSTHLAAAEFTFNFTGVWNRTYGGSAVNSPAAIALSGNAAFFYLGWIPVADNTLHATTINSGTGVVITDVQVLDTAGNAFVAQHVAIALMPNTAFTAYVFDIATLVGTTQSRVMAIEYNGDVANINKNVYTLKRSVALVSDMISSQATTADFKLYFLVAYRSAATNSVLGINFQQTLQNAAVYLMSYDDAVVCGRSLRGQYISQDNTSSASSDGAVGCFGTRAITYSDQTIAQNATTFGGAAVIRAYFFQEIARSTSALQDMLVCGGSPSVFDGANAVEAGFHVFPECLCLGAAQDLDKGGLYGYTTNVTGVSNFTSVRANSTAYGVGAKITGKSTGVAAGLAWGHIWVAVTNGVSAAASPAVWFLGGQVVDNTVVWQDAGLEAPQKKWAAGLTPAQMPTGTVIFSNVAGSFAVYVVIATGGGNTVTDPGTATWSGAGGPGWSTTTSSTSGVLADGYNYLCVGTLTELTPNQAYSYAFVYEWVDDQGLLHMSAPSPVVSAGTLSNDGGASNALFVVSTLRLSRKGNVRIGVYRTIGNGTILYKTALLQNDPTVDAIAVVDTVLDTTAATGIILYCGSLGAGGLPNAPPPACSTMAVWGQRVVSNNLEDPYTIWPSKLINISSAYDDVPAWSDELFIQVDASFGPVRGLMQMDGQLVVFQDRRICIVSGDGPDNTGGGSPFGQPQPIATDVGCNNPTSIVMTPQGIIFQSQKGVYLLTRGLTTEYVGAPIEGVNSGSGPLPFQAAVQVPNTTQVLFQEDGPGAIWVYDYFAGQWSSWTVQTNGDDNFNSMIVWTAPQESHPVVVGIDDTGTVIRQSNNYVDFAGGQYSFAMIFGPIRLAGDQPYVRVRSASFLFKCGGATTGVTFDVYADYDTTNIVHTTAQSILVGQDVAQVLLPAPGKYRAISFGVRETAVGSDVLLEALTLEIGTEDGVYRLPSAKRTT